MQRLLASRGAASWPQFVRNLVETRVVLPRIRLYCCIGIYSRILRNTEWHSKKDIEVTADFLVVSTGAADAILYLPGLTC